MQNFKSLFVLGLTAVVMTGCIGGGSEEPTENTDSNTATTQASTETESTEKSEALVRVVEYFDFACGYCARASQVNKVLKEKYGDKIEFTHKSMNNFSQSTPVHKAYTCIAEADPAKADAFQEKYFADYMGKYDDASIEAIATIVGADVEAMNDCVKSDTPDTILAKQKDEAARYGAKGTPFYVINEYMIQPGFLDAAGFSRQIDKIIEDAGQTAPAAVETPEAEEVVVEEKPTTNVEQVTEETTEEPAAETEAESTEEATE